MFGQNPKRPPSKGDGTSLEVQDIFKTIQGEGPYTGWPSIFIRLGGCNLACSFCDTEFEQFREMSLHDIQQTVALLDTTRIIPLIVITGGEPFRQPVHLLCEGLLAQSYQVQIETNGTLYQALPKAVSIICSPKPTNQTYHPIRPDLLPHITAFKFIISASQTPYQNIAEIGQTSHHIPVYIQPMDEQDPVKNLENTQYTIELAKNRGYRLSLQTHKILGIP